MEAARTTVPACHTPPHASTRATPPTKQPTTPAEKAHERAHLRRVALMLRPAELRSSTAGSNTRLSACHGVSKTQVVVVG